MNCPFCETQDSKVVDSRYVQDGIRRRRECLMCSLRFTTYEKIHTQLLSVIKRDNTKEAFSIEKLTKRFDSNILVSEKVWRLLKSEDGKSLGPTPIEGLKQKMEIFQIH